MSFSSVNYASRYFATLDRIARAIVATDGAGTVQEFDSAMAAFADWCRDAGAAGGKLMFVGNGGSASIASHMGIDFTKNGRIKAMAFNDPMYLTCLSNDLGYENAFAFQVDRHAEPRDILVAISSSGRSPNILNAVAAARNHAARVVTMSGFTPDNALRGLGDLNFYVPVDQYGYVELLHCSLCHCVLDGLTNTATD
jgi:D-sedoheptulose 7-phosphate isomerase